MPVLFMRMSNQLLCARKSAAPPPIEEKRVRSTSTTSIYGYGGRESAMAFAISSPFAAVRAEYLGPGLLQQSG